MEFNKDKHYLGTLCKYNHEYKDTGMSLRYKSNGHNCVECLVIYGKKRRIENKDNMKEYLHDYYKKNKEHHKIQCKLWSKKNKKKIIEMRQTYYKKNKEKIYKLSTQWKKDNPEKLKEMNKRYSLKHKEEINKRSKDWGLKNKERMCFLTKRWKENNPEKHKIIQKKAYTKIRSTLKGKINHRMSASVRQSLIKGKNGYRWESLVGYTAKDLEKHLESLFTKEMSWKLFMDGGIHIDHKIPISVFNFNSYNDIDFKRCWALSNLQPLLAKDNLIKHDKIYKDFQPSLCIGVKL